MRVAGVLYQALWESVFALSGGEHLNTAQRSWCWLLAWREVVLSYARWPPISFIPIICQFFYQLINSNQGFEKKKILHAYLGSYEL